MSKINFKKYLTDNVLKFWLDIAIDDEFGGIFTQVERDGTVYGEEKSVWFQGRALWTFAKAYNKIDKNPTYLNACEKIYNFLLKCVDSDGRMFFTVKRDGAPIQKRRYYFSETFAAIGCAQYYKATGDAKVWENAERFFKIADDCFNNPSLNAPKYFTKGKALSPVMIMMATARSMAECAPNPEKYQELANKYKEEVIFGGYFNKELKVVLESVSENGEFVNTPNGRIVNPGHSLETAWFLLVEGLISGDKNALNVGKEIIDYTMPIGLDKKYGGIISFTDALGKPPLQLEWDMKLWWPQNEAIIANLMAYKIFGEKKYKKQYEQLLKYAFNKFEDKKHGEWYGYLHYNSTPANYIKGNIFKGPFHLPRMLMILCAIEDDKMIEFFK